jgi:penicillin G amidase
LCCRPSGQVLAQQVLGRYLAVGRNHDPAFQFPFEWADAPLLAILHANAPTLLPPDGQRHGRNRFVAECAQRAAAELVAMSGGSQLPTWGELNQVGMVHPLVRLAPWARALLGVRPQPQAGSLHTVRTCVPGFAAVGRAVLPLGGEPVFELPGGQSGHPLSRHFDDRHGVWSRATPRADRKARIRCVGMLQPVSAERTERTMVGSGRDDG